MIVCMIILVVSFLLDGVLTNFLPFSVGDLSLFTPLTTIVAIVVLYPLFYKQEKKYYILSFVTGIIYDLFYTNLWFFDGFMFLFIAFIVCHLSRVMGDNYLKILLQILVIIIIYEVSFALLIALFNLVPMTIERLIYKISHSLILNLIYGEILYVIIKALPKKAKKIRIS